VGREWARFIKAVVSSICMAANSRAILLAGAAVILVITAITATIDGGDYTLPIALALVAILALLVFSIMMQDKESEKGSTPLLTSNSNSVTNSLTGQDDLPNPNDSGIDVPIL